MAQQLQGGGAPAPDRRPDKPRRPLVAIQPTRLWVVDPVVVEYMIHWDAQADRSYGCGYYAGEGPCEACDERGLPRRLIRMVQVQDMAQRYPVVLFGLTQQALIDCPRFADADGVLPWTLIETWRTPRKLTGRQYIRFLHADGPARRPETRPTLQILRELWEAPSRKPVREGPRIWTPHPDDDIPGVGDPANDPRPEEPNRGS